MISWSRCFICYRVKHPFFWILLRKEPKFVHICGASILRLGQRKFTGVVSGTRTRRRFQKVVTQLPPGSLPLLRQRWWNCAVTCRVLFSWGTWPHLDWPGKSFKLRLRHLWQNWMGSEVFPVYSRIFCNWSGVFCNGQFWVRFLWKVGFWSYWGLYRSKRFTKLPFFEVPVFFFNENRIIALGMHFKHLIIKVEGWCTLLSCTSMTVCVPLFGNNSVNPSLM